MLFKFLTCLVFSIGLFSYSQTITGTVLDYKTQQPVEAVSVYFDNTTIGTVTDTNGRFSLDYSEAIKSSLIISFLGYKSEVITDYRSKQNVTVLLKESIDALEAVVIKADDGLTRKQKLFIFKREFLGESKFARSCKILNEDDLILNYFKNERKLNVRANSPIIIRNESLQYEVSYDISFFEIDFINVVLEDNYEIFDVKTVTYAGTTFYKKLEDFNKKAAVRNREQAYKGSVHQFMRSLYHNTLKDNHYKIYDTKFLVNPEDYINITYSNNPELKTLKLVKPITILYDNERKSGMKLKTPSILIDKYGHYSNPTEVEFTGFMGKQRLGDLLPLDYTL
ncbi:carboxypeptidase-like regulatory domain-containing protein [Flavobacteriaceae bacterium XHP0103]|uniref:carboxypeptidase-like regulatory domain-containing protein n=1 Tax=Marixanthotalea marina TaxID=2844359 RepID=UPI002989AA5C|nr:carboxypeptidase-like regulatory domain-containing protein [Marixanthotalea marina]MBU3820461.1 carboxypeptidase-like regulatory domain-containing protein [Marixanthotalea marina]